MCYNGGAVSAWLKFFRVVNLPTVPGDVLAGAAVAAAASGSPARPALPIVAASLSAVFVYLFGLADNDLVGAAADGAGRPIPDGEISFAAARIARGLCLFAALAVGAVADLPPAWWVSVLSLSVACVVYNRTKWCLVMGLCRGLNVACGGLAAGVHPAVWREPAAAAWTAACALVWTAYVAWVTRCSEGEEADPARRRFVGSLIGAIVYLQLGVLLIVYVVEPVSLLRNLLLAGAGLLVALRLAKRALPGVSAS